MGSSCVYLWPMGTRNDRDRSTRELDAQELGRLVKQTGEQAVVAQEQEDSPSSPRTQTLQDPMTMALLAEVARNSRTQDFDPESMPEDAKVPVEADTVHPHVKRR
jgi:hypothetical protein